MNVLVTGANGFIGKNLIVHLNNLGMLVIKYTRENSIQDLLDMLKKSDFIIHLAGENRPIDERDFIPTNVELTSSICEAVRSIGRKIPIILASSIQATFDNPYGRSKLKAEAVVQKFKVDTGNPVNIYRLPGVFGKWCKPNYNSVVATFCHNISHNLPIKINDPSFELNLVYIDDVVEELINVVLEKLDTKKVLSVQPEYKITLGQLSDQIKLFKKNCDSLAIEGLSGEIVRKLYSTYVSYLPSNSHDNPNLQGIEVNKI